MYPPPLTGTFASEQVAYLFRPTLVSDELLRDPPRRIAQLCRLDELPLLDTQTCRISAGSR
jgi:hypothetical protein